MPSKNPGKVQTATIANGAALSDSQPLAGGALIGIYIPAAWTAANLTFQASEDGATWSDVHSPDGTEYVVTVNAAGQYYPLPVADLLGPSFLRVRSGTAAAAVNQGGSRSLVLKVRPV